MDELMMRRILLTLFVTVGLICHAVGQQGYNQRRPILQVTDVTTDRTVPSANFEKKQNETVRYCGSYRFVRPMHKNSVFR